MIRFHPQPDSTPFPEHWDQTSADACVFRPTRIFAFHLYFDIGLCSERQGILPDGLELLNRGSAATVCFYSP